MSITSMSRRRGTRSSLRVWVCGFTACTALAQSERPAALEALQESRQSLGSGEIKWTVRQNGEQEREFHFVSRFARNGDWIFENRGDQDGWTLHDGYTGAGTSKFPRLYLHNADGYWQFNETGTHCSWWQGEAPDWLADAAKDVCAVGTYPTSGNIPYALSTSAIWGTQQVPVAGWRERRQGALYVVTAEQENGGETTWYINADRDWNAERATFSVRGTVVAEAVCELGQFDGVWLPARTDYYRDGRLVESIKIDSARLNQPKDKGRFTLADLGVEPGTHISRQTAPTVGGGALIWNGEDICARERWDDDIESGKRQWGPTFRRMFSGEGYSSPYETDEQRAQMTIDRLRMAVRLATERHKGLWESFVRDFIARYKLNDAQAQEADQLLAKCQERANAHIDRNKSRWTTLQSKVEVAAKEGKTEEVKKLTEEIGKLAAPLEEIFEKQLKPGLDKIPTRAQRKAVDEAEQRKQTESSDQESTPAPQPATRPASDGGKTP